MPSLLDHADTVDEFSAEDQIMRAGGRVPRLKIFQLGIVEKTPILLLRNHFSTILLF